jgi:hypothetical protein
MFEDDLDEDLSYSEASREDEELTKQEGEEEDAL